MKILNTSNNWYNIVHNSISNINYKEKFSNKFIVYLNKNLTISVIHHSLKFLSPKKLIYFNVIIPENIIAFKKLIENYENRK